MAKVQTPPARATGRGGPARADDWEESFSADAAAEIVSSTDDLLGALTTALSALQRGGREPDRRLALKSSFTSAKHGLGALKALLLYVTGRDPLQLQELHATGLTQEQLEACREMQSAEGVSPSVIRQAIETKEVQYIANAQAHAPGHMTASLAAGSHSVLCAPVLEPLTGTVLAVLYFQNPGLKRAFTLAHRNWLASYATALSHGFGMHLETERRIDELQEDARSLRTQREEGVPEIVGESEATRKLRGFLHATLIPEVMDRPQGKPILLLGPSGTGKDQIARYLHFYSETRNRAPFLPFNCAGMGAGEMTKSILFGHVRGAYTGATEDRLGLFREAHKGVLFLDEIGELPIDGQAELLRVIQECRVTPLGSSRSTPVDVQLVIATNRDLEAEVAARRFREDLYYRIAVHVIRLAPLASSSRLGDVRPLLTHFIAVQEAQSKKKVAGLTPEALGALLAYSWPGNIRQLINACSVLVAYARRGAWITLDDVTTHCPYVVDPGARRPDAALVSADSSATFKEAALAWEREFLKERLLAHGGNQTKAAHSLGFDYSTLLRKMARCGLPGAWGRGTDDEDGNDNE